MEVSTVRFFTYTVMHDFTKTDDERNFYGVLTLENFDKNTDDLPNLKTWLETNMVLTPLPANFISIVFEVIPANRAPTIDEMISLPFKI